jgi:hypothetical protein
MTGILSGANIGSSNNQIPAVKVSKERDKSVPTLNGRVRMQEWTKITAENEHMLKRLQESKSSYNVYDWEQDRKV